MPLDPQECRRQALACVRLAQTSLSPQARRTYTEVARTWLTIAGDLADLESQLKADLRRKLARQGAAAWLTGTAFGHS